MKGTMRKVEIPKKHRATVVKMWEIITSAELDVDRAQTRLLKVKSRWEDKLAKIVKDLSLDPTLPIIVSRDGTHVLVPDVDNMAQKFIEAASVHIYNLFIKEIDGSNLLECVHCECTGLVAAKMTHRDTCQALPVLRNLREFMPLGGKNERVC